MGWSFNETEKLKGDEVRYYKKPGYFANLWKQISGFFGRIWDFLTLCCVSGDDMQNEDEKVD